MQSKFIVNSCHQKEFAYLSALMKRSEGHYAVWVNVTTRQEEGKPTSAPSDDKNDQSEPYSATKLMLR